MLLYFRRQILTLIYVLFADDLILFAETAEYLTLHEQITHEHDKGSTSAYSFIFGDGTKKIPNEYKYVGVVFMTSGQNIFKNSYTHLATQARKGISTVRYSSI